MKIEPKQIRPAVKGKADFFSWQLYRWVRKHPDRTRIFVGWNQIDGSVGESYPNDFLYIGSRDDQWVVGARLRTICLTGEKLQSWAYPESQDWKDVTDQFWKDYFRIGVCAIWGDYSWHNWQYINDSKRECQYCKRLESKEIEMVPTERWKAA